MGLIMGWIQIMWRYGGSNFSLGGDPYGRMLARKRRAERQMLDLLESQWKDCSDA